MVVRKPRKIRGVHELNPEPPPPSPSFFEWVKTQTDAHMVPLNSMPLGAQGDLSKIGYRFKITLDDAIKHSNRGFYPLAWLYRDMFALGVKTRAQQRERDRMKYAFRNTGPGMVVISIAPYMSDEYGLILMLFSGEAVRMTDAGFVVRSSMGRNIKVPFYNVFGIEERLGPDATIWFPDMHYSHQRLAWLIGRYFVKFGHYPELYDYFFEAHKQFLATQAKGSKSQ